MQIQWEEDSSRKVEDSNPSATRGFFLAKYLVKCTCSIIFAVELVDVYTCEFYYVECYCDRCTLNWNKRAIVLTTQLIEASQNQNGEQKEKLLGANVE